MQTAALATDIVQQLPGDIASQLTLVFGSEAAAAATGGSQHAGCRCISLGDAFLDSISGYILLVAPTQDQVICRSLVAFRHSPTCTALTLLGCDRDYVFDH